MSRSFGLPYEDDSWPSERDLDRLVYSASGQFIYAATVVEYCHPMQQLDIVLSLSTTEIGTSPPAELDTLYACILSANANVPLTMCILGAYFAIPNSNRPIAFNSWSAFLVYTAEVLNLFSEDRTRFYSSLMQTTVEFVVTMLHWTISSQIRHTQGDFIYHTKSSMRTW